MQTRAVLVRFGGIPIALIGLLLIMAPFFGLGIDDDILSLFQRAGFGILLMGLLILFLFSVRTIPREVSTSFIVDNGRNTARLLQGLNLHGKGVYFPPVGRLKEDRVYIPLEKHDLPLPEISDDTVFNVGSTGPSMGISIVPPGKGLVDSVERLTGRRFGDDDLWDAEESLQRLSKGTGMFRSVELKDRKGSIQLRIIHETEADICSGLWKEYGELHEQAGCPLCSAVLCATSRMAMTPLRIRSAEKTPLGTEYILEKVVR